MPRTWVIAIAAGLGLLGVLLLFRGKSAETFGDAASGEKRGARLAARDAPEGDRESAAAAVRERLASRSTNRRADSGSSFDSSEPDSVASAVERAREGGASRRGSRGSMPGLAPNAASQGEDFSDDTSAAGADGSPARSAGAGATDSKPDSKPGSQRDSTGKTETTSQAAPAGTPGPDDDPNGPAITLKFDKSTLPDKGDAAPIVESGVTIDDRGAHFSEGAQFAIPPAESVTGQAATISFWLVPDWDGDPESNASFFQWRTGTFENRVQIFKNGRYLRFIFTDNTGEESGVGTDISTWRSGEGHVVTATWGDGVTALYVDGVSVGYREYNGELQMPPGTGYLVGSDFRGGAPGASSSLRDFHIYPRALSADEVATLAAQSRH